MCTPQVTAGMVDEVQMRTKKMLPFHAAFELPADPNAGQRPVSEYDAIGDFDNDEVRWTALNSTERH